MSIKNNIEAIQQTLPPGCRLVAVSKSQPMDRIFEAYKSGQRVFGENRVQELMEKYEALPKDVAWHMIGHLQRNKVKYIAPFIALIHSVDTYKLLEEVSRQGQRFNRTISCLLQVHIAREETKFGFSEEELEALLQSDRLPGLTHIEIKGLMGMATFTANLDQVRDEFRFLHMLFLRLRDHALPAGVRMEELSMGMSNDYQVAAELGSTLVRIGTAIFGERNKQVV